jgi:opacity protein-like surface antigen
VKNLLKVSIITMGFIILVTTNSFALVDAAVWGGYMFNSELEGNSDDPKGGQYGAKAHYNKSLIPLLEIGVGGFYQYSKLKFDYDLTDKEKDIDRQSAGLDVNLILGIPFVHPYVRGTYSFWDKIKKLNDSETKYLQAFGAGGGIEFAFIPFVRLYGEYMYDYTHHDESIKSHSANIGLKVDF